MLGTTHGSRIDTLVKSMIENSAGKDIIAMAPECMESMNKLRAFMFENVYHNNRVKKDEDLAEVDKIIRFLYSYYQEHPEKMSEDRRSMIDEFGINEVVKDLVAGMTDRYAESVYKEITNRR